MYSSSEIKINFGNVVWEIVKTLAILFGIALFIKYFIVQTFIVSGSSMEPDYHNKDFLIVNEVSYRVSPPSRGDVVIFKHPDEPCLTYSNKNLLARALSQNPCVNYIKRVIGLPGETVEVKNGKVFVFNSEFKNGKQLEEPYIGAGVQTLGDKKTEVKENEYFVLGDNRLPNASSDSRDWGTVPRDMITGNAVLRISFAHPFSFVYYPVFERLKKGEYGF